MQHKVGLKKGMVDIHPNTRRPLMHRLVRVQWSVCSRSTLAEGVRSALAAPRIRLMPSSDKVVKDDRDWMNTGIRIWCLSRGEVTAQP